MSLSAGARKLVIIILKKCFPNKESAIDFLNTAGIEELTPLCDRLQMKAGLDHNDVMTFCNSENILPLLLLTIGKSKRGYDDAVRLAWHLSKERDNATAEFNSTLDNLTRTLKVVEAPPNSLEGLIDSSRPFLDIHKLQEWVDRTKRTVCKIRCDGVEKGTGFLIEADMILTCYHVVQSHISNGERSKIEVQFDYYDGAEPTKWIPVDPSWTIPHSKYCWKEDVNMTDGDPDKTFLDFALLKLPKPFDNSRRPYLLAEGIEPPTDGGPILIAGHPGPVVLQKMKVSMAAPGIEKVSAKGTRLIYKVDTQRGSSGSPVFDGHFRLIGMHHNRGELNPQVPDRYTNNRGIPIHLIAKAIEEMTKTTPFSSIPWATPTLIAFVAFFLSRVICPLWTDHICASFPRSAGLVMACITMAFIYCIFELWYRTPKYWELRAFVFCSSGLVGHSW